MKRNILASYVSQFYVTTLGILILPLYIRYMGEEAYGLVGFFAMLQAWFGLLDMGLAPAIGRETARYRGGGLSSLAYRQLYRVLCMIFIIVALLGAAGLLLASDWLAINWLNAKELPLFDVVISVKIMAISVALRWLCGLFRGVIVGHERLLWLSGFNVFISTLRFFGVFPVMWVYGFTPIVFFNFQLLMALVEAIGMFLFSRRLLPVLHGEQVSIGWSFRPVKSLLKFALTIAFTSSVWVLVTQTDKLVLSGILPLAEYGFFTLAVLAASGIMLVSSPLSRAIMPRMVKLFAEGKGDEMIVVYRNATQLISIVAGSAAITLSLCAQQVLFAWTGDMALAEKAAPILQLYAVGNGFMSLAAFPYYLQYAKGNLRYHLVGNVGMVVIIIPAIVWAASEFGGVGAGYIWLSGNGLFLLLWVAYVHHKLQPGLHLQWICQDIVMIVLPAVFLPLLTIFIAVDVETRLGNFNLVMLIFLEAFCVAIMFSPKGREWICAIAARS